MTRRAFQVGIIQLFSNSKWFKNNGICLSTQLPSIAIIGGTFVLNAQIGKKKGQKPSVYGSEGFSTQGPLPLLSFFLVFNALFLATFCSYHWKFEKHTHTHGGWERLGRDQWSGGDIGNTLNNKNLILKNMCIFYPFVQPIENLVSAALWTSMQAMAA